MHDNLWLVFNRRSGRSKGKALKAVPLLNLSIIAEADISNPPWVNFPSAPTARWLE
jgi:hypothetical protein